MHYFNCNILFQTERVVTQEGAQWSWSDLGKEDGHTYPHSSESISLSASLHRLRGDHNQVWSHQENLLSLTGKYSKTCYLSRVSTQKSVTVLFSGKWLYKSGDYIFSSVFTYVQ